VEDMAARADVLLLAVKPQHFEAVLGRLSHI
jgi:pyrroline-5-carboxylate reductase